MPAYQGSTLSLEAVEQYFSHINPIAQRIARDIRETKSKYGQLWYTLNPHEQNEVINETLIKPEISLRYFDNFASPSSSLSSQLSSVSYSEMIICRITKEIERSGSTDSLTVPNNTITELALPHKSRVEKSCVKSTFRTKSKALDFKNYYSFDGRNLKTFAHQRVAQKLVQDDTSGGFCDEHSKPFSFRTKSQINLHKYDNADTKTAPYFVPNEPEEDCDEICLLSGLHKKSFAAEICDESKFETAANYKKLQDELKLNIGNINKQNMDASNNKAPYNRLDNANEPGQFSLSVKHTSKKVTKAFDSKKLCVSNNNSSKSKTTLKPFIDTGTTATSSVTYAAYTDGYFEQEESSNLMQNCGNSDILTASSSSAATSDDDRDEYDEKTLCEDVKLLDNDVILRRGFDFLNNW